MSSNMLSAGFVEARDQDKLTHSQLALSSALLAFTLGFVTATTSPASETGSSASGNGAMFSHKRGSGGGGGGGDGGGPLKPVTSVLGARESAEEDVRKVEEEATRNPYEVSYHA
jgi:hypothetical protein